MPKDMKILLYYLLTNLVQGYSPAEIYTVRYHNSRKEIMNKISTILVIACANKYLYQNI